MIDLAVKIDGPSDGPALVSLFDLIQHVTGVRPAVTFYAGAARALRRGALRLRAWFRPDCLAALAAEALTAPVFTGRQSCRVVWL